MLKLLEHRATERAGKCGERDELRQELEEVRRKLECLDSCFDRTDDEALIESLIYQRNGLMAHYGYLLHRAKLAPQAKVATTTEVVATAEPTVPEDAPQQPIQEPGTPYQGRATAG